MIIRSQREELSLMMASDKNFGSVIFEAGIKNPIARDTGDNSFQFRPIKTYTNQEELLYTS